MLPEPLHGIELRRIRRERHQLNLIGVSGQESENGFCKMNAVVIDHDIDFASGNTIRWLEYLAEYRAEQGIILMLADLQRFPQGFHRFI